MSTTNINFVNYATIAIIPKPAVKAVKNPKQPKIINMSTGCYLPTKTSGGKLVYVHNPATETTVEDRLEFLRMMYKVITANAYCVADSVRDTAVRIGKTVKDIKAASIAVHDKHYSRRQKDVTVDSVNAMAKSNTINTQAIPTRISANQTTVSTTDPTRKYRNLLACYIYPKSDTRSSREGLKTFNSFADVPKTYTELIRILSNVGEHRSNTDRTLAKTLLKLLDPSTEFYGSFLDCNPDIVGYRMMASALKIMSVDNHIYGVSVSDSDVGRSHSLLKHLEKTFNYKNETLTAQVIYAESTTEHIKTASAPAAPKAQ